MAVGTTAAILGAAAIGTAGSVAAGSMQAGAARDAANAQAGSAKQAAQVQRDAMQQTRVDAYPWAIAGAQALYKYMGELGIPMPEDPILPDINAGPLGQQYTKTTTTRRNGRKVTQPVQADPITFTEGKSFQETPGYQFQVEQGEQGVLNNLSALGMRDSGAALKALTKYRSGVANQEYNNYLNRLAGVAGMGQSQVQSNNSITMAGASNIGNALQNAGAARASGYVGAGNAWGNAIGNISNTWGNALGMMSTGGGGGNWPSAPTMGSGLF